MATTTQLMTAEELFKLQHGPWRYELVKGELRTISPAGFEHGAVIINLSLPLAHHVKAHDLGLVCGAETGFLITTDPDTVRAPDIAFVRRERITKTGIPKGYWPGAPDLAVEVLSPSDTIYGVDEKVEEWLAAGASAVWVVNPKRRAVTGYRPQAKPIALAGDEELDGQEVVPGFRCRVAEIFI